MRPVRIAELLEPFLSTAITPNPSHSELGPATTPNPCHSEPGQRPGEEPALAPAATDRSQPALSEAKRLTTNDLDHISTYIDILLRWNARINLTAIRDEEQIVTRHFGESLFAARHLFPTRSPKDYRGTAEENGGRAALQSHVSGEARAGALAPEAVPQDLRPNTQDRFSVADLGSGAGFPGLPIKLWAPHISLTLIESNHKKATFLREVTRALTLTDVNIQTARQRGIRRASFDVVTLRAVERFESILPVAANLLAPAGRLALLISSAQAAQARAALPNLSWSAPKPIPLSRSRVLVVARTNLNQDS